GVGGRCVFFRHTHQRGPHPFPTRRSSDLGFSRASACGPPPAGAVEAPAAVVRSNGCVLKCPLYIVSASRVILRVRRCGHDRFPRSEEHTSALQSREKLVCRPLPEKKKEKS